MSDKSATTGDAGTESAEPAIDVTKVRFEKDPFIRYVTMSEESARQFIGEENTAEVVDAGPADPQRYKPGARIFHIYPRQDIAAQDAQTDPPENT